MRPSDCRSSFGHLKYNFVEHLGGGTEQWGTLAVHFTHGWRRKVGGAPEAHLVGAEGLGVAQLAELSLGAQQFGLDFWIHVCQKIPHIVHRGHGELRDGQLQRAGKGDQTFLKDDICSQGASCW